MDNVCRLDHQHNNNRHIICKGVHHTPNNYTYIFNIFFHHSNKNPRNNISIFHYKIIHNYSQYICHYPNTLIDYISYILSLNFRIYILDNFHIFCIHNPLNNIQFHKNYIPNNYHIFCNYQNTFYMSFHFLINNSLGYKLYNFILLCILYNDIHNSQS
jgi:hypothetical protein